MIDIRRDHAALMAAFQAAEDGKAGQDTFNPRLTTAQINKLDLISRDRRRGHAPRLSEVSVTL
ncbi:MAG: hypothetical protein SVO96_06935 [Pseudomonadota bacterium]|nr:hypothetical protein [Pseudomonadota bacterium]